MNSPEMSVDGNLRSRLGGSGHIESTVGLDGQVVHNRSSTSLCDISPSQLVHPSCMDSAGEVTLW